MRMERRGILKAGLFSLLASCWRAGAAHAGSFGNVAAFRQHIITILEDRHLARNIVADPVNPAKFKATIHGEGSAVDVGNAFRYLNANPEENASELIERFVRSLTSDPRMAGAEGNIVAVLRTRDYAQQIGADGFQEPLGADLVIVYMVDEPDAMRPVSKADLPGLDLAGVRKAALANVGAWLPKVVADNRLGAGTLYFVEGNTMLSPSLLLLEDFWKSVTVRFPGDVLIALPRKDQLFLFDDNGSAALRAGIRQLIDATFEDNFNLLSRQLYARRGGKIVAVTD